MQKLHAYMYSLIFLKHILQETRSNILQEKIYKYFVLVALHDYNLTVLNIIICN